MTLSIATNLRTRLVDQLCTALSDATVYGDVVVSGWSLRKLSGIKSIPDKGKVAADLRAFIGDDPFTTFVVDELNAQFKVEQPRYDDITRPLSSYAAYGDLKSIAVGLMDVFETLPWLYQMTVRLPTSLGTVLAQSPTEIILSPRHKIVAGGALKATYPLKENVPRLSNLLAGRVDSAWDEEAAYLQVSFDGYLRDRLTESFFAARDEVLTFFGLGVALGIFSEYAPSPSDGDRKTSHLFLHRSEEGRWVEQEAREIEEHYRNGIGSLVLAGAVSKDVEVLREKLERIGTVLRSDAGKKIGLSARWLFDSHCGRDALLQYVQAAVAVEILLGDDEVDPNVGLTTLMANRCAYLIAKTPAARTNLLNLFRDIYKVRSKIVHRGKARLNSEEMNLFHYLQTILISVIDIEQKALERAERSKAKADRLRDII